MNRTAWLQQWRMQRFCDVLERFEAKRLTALDSAGLLGMLESGFWRCRRRYVEKDQDGLFSRRLGKASVQRRAWSAVMGPLRPMTMRRLAAVRPRSPAR